MLLLFILFLLLPLCSALEDLFLCDKDSVCDLNLTLWLVVALPAAMSWVLFIGADGGVRTVYFCFSNRMTSSLLVSLGTRSIPVSLADWSTPDVTDLSPGFASGSTYWRSMVSGSTLGVLPRC